MAEDKMVCPSCGNQVDAGTSACGFCGYMFSGQNPPNFQPPSTTPQQPTPTSPPSAFSPPSGFSVEQPPQVGPTSYGTPPGVIVARGGGGLRLLIFLIVLIIIVATAVPVYFAFRSVDKAVGDIKVPDFRISLPGNLGGGAGGGPVPVKMEGAFRGARPLVAQLKGSGIKCGQIRIITSNDFVEAADCSVGAEPVSIQVYFNGPALSSIKGSLGDMQGSNVVHRANWILLCPTSRPLAREIAKALGARLV